MAINLGAAYVDIVPSTGNLAKDLRGKLNKPLEDSGESSGRGFGSRFMSGLGGLGSKVTSGLSTVMKGSGLAVGGVFAGALVSGMGRLTAIDDAKGKLAGLGHTAEGVEKIMESALSSVKGTAFGLDEAAGVSASAVAAGIEPGKELTKYLTLVADASTIAGTSMGEMGAILNKTTTSGKVYTQELNQLADRGLPVFQWLQREYGVTAEGLKKMVSDGKVDAETFQRVLTENIGGAAQESGKTFTGGLKNVKAALGRAGATLLAPVFEGLKAAMPRIIEVIDSLSSQIPAMLDKVGPIAGRVFGRITEVVGGFVERLRGVDWASLFGKAQKLLGPLVKSIGEFAGSLVELGRKALPPVIAAVQKFGPLIAGAALVGAVKALQGAFKALSGVIGFVADNFDALGPLIAGAAAGFAAYKAVIGTITLVTKAWTAAQALLNIALNANPIMLAVMAIGALVAGVVLAYQKVDWFRNLVDAAAGAIVAAFTWIKDVVVGVFSWMRDNWQLLLGILTGPIGAAVGIIVMHWDTIRNAVMAVFNWIRDNWQLVLGLITGPIGHAVGIITTHWDTIKNTFTAVKDWIGDRVTDIVNFFSGLPGRIADALSNIWDAVTSPFAEPLQWIVDKVQALIDKFRSIQDEIMGRARVGIDYDALRAASGGGGVPRYHTGGIVPGRPGEERLIMAMAGEAVLTPAQQSALMSRSGATLNFEVYGPDAKRVAEQVAFDFGRGGR